MPTYPKLALAAGATVGATLATMAVFAMPGWATPFAIDNLSAERGRAGDTVTVTGTRLDDVTGITLGDRNASYTQNEQALTITVPKGARTGTLSIVAGDTVHNTPFTILPPTAANLVLHKPAASPPHGSSITVTGALQAPVDVNGESVQVWRRTPNTAWDKAAELVADSTGRISGRLVVTGNAEYELRHPGSERVAATTSESHSVAATAAVTLSAQSTSSTTGKFVLTGTAAPASVGTVTITRTTDGTARTAATGTVRSDGTFTVTVTAMAGKHTFTATTAATDTHDAGSSEAVAVESYATALKPGDQGSSVARLQQRLVELKYDHGEVTGTYGYQTKMAVMAFQKVNGLTRDGIAGPATRAALDDPKSISLREQRSGLYVEVDLSQQVALVGRDGQLVKILNTSSGNGEIYKRPGGGYGRANTPTGHFKVQRKIDGIRRAPLGNLYRPVYFYGGIAFHGSPSVPGYPASHGCLRLPNPSMDRLFGQLTVGTSVYVYR